MASRIEDYRSQTCDDCGVESVNLTIRDGLALCPDCLNRDDSEPSITLSLLNLADSLRAEIRSERADKRDILLSHGCLLQDITEAKSRVARAIAALSESPAGSPERCALRAYREVLSWLP